jgi:hypothetical protein
VVPYSRLYVASICLTWYFYTEQQHDIGRKNQGQQQYTMLSVSARGAQKVWNGEKNVENVQKNEKKKVQNNDQGEARSRDLLGFVLTTVNEM